MHGRYAPDTRAFFSCNDGYMRTGSLFITCQDSGNWDPEIPTCDEGIEQKHYSKIYSSIYLLFKY